MSISQILQNGLSGISASQAGLAVISQNVANANTVGYSRQTVSLQQRVINGISSGVGVGDTKRAVDDFLLREIVVQQAAEGEAAVISEYYTNIQTRFGSPGSNSSLSADLSSFGSALETLSINPEDPALRFNVVATGVTVARGISVLSTSVQTLRSQADAGIDSTVDEINAQLAIVFDLNSAIASIKARGGITLNLEDQRDITITNLSKNIAINTFTGESGEVTILVQGGLTLLDTNLRQLEYTPSAAVSSGTIFGAINIQTLDSNGDTIGIVNELVSSAVSGSVVSNVSGGRLEGLLHVRDKVLTDLSAQISTLATRVRDEYNTIHNSGSSFPAVNSLTSTLPVASGDSLTATGQIRIAVVNSDGTLGSGLID